MWNNLRYQENTNQNDWDSSLHLSVWLTSEIQVYAGKDVDQGEHPSTDGASINLVNLL